MKRENILTDTTDNVIDLNTARETRPALITGGPTGDDNWIKSLDVGVVFNAKAKPSQSKQPNPFLDLYCVLEHKDKTVNLMQKLPDGRQIDLWFESLPFSRGNILVEVIATVKFGYGPENTEDTTEAPEVEEVQGKEDDHGNSDRPV